MEQEPSTADQMEATCVGEKGIPNACKAHTHRVYIQCGIEAACMFWLWDKSAVLQSRENPTGGSSSLLDRWEVPIGVFPLLGTPQCDCLFNRISRRTVEDEASLGLIVILASFG
jgi:hypothetical protein